MVITLRGGGMGVSTCKTNDKQFLINVLNLQREYSQGNQIKTYLFERLKTENIAAWINQTKGRTFRFGRCQSTPPIMWIYLLQVLPFGNL